MHDEKIYRYCAEKKGTAVSGLIQSSSRTLAHAELRLRGLTAIRLSAIRPWSLYFKKVGRELEIVSFLRQIQCCLKAGHGLGDLFNQLPQPTDPMLSAIITLIKAHISQGKAVHLALKQHPEFFDFSTCAFFAVGEQNACLIDVIGLLIEERLWLIRTQQQLIQSSYYPIMIIVSVCLVGIIMLKMVVPLFEDLLVHAGPQQSALTLGLLWLSKQALGYWCIIFSPWIVSLLAWLRRSPRAQAKLRWLVCCIPLINRMYRAYLIVRICRSLILAIQSGQSLGQAMAHLDSLGCCPHHEVSLHKMIRIYTETLQLGHAMQSCRLLPSWSIPLVVQAERQGDLIPVLRDIALFSEQSLAAHSKKIEVMIGPIVILLASLVTSIILVGLYLPMLHMGFDLD